MLKVRRHRGGQSEMKLPARFASKCRRFEFAVEFDHRLLADLQGSLIDAIQVRDQDNHDREGQS